jgi:hypothetical protein
MKLAHFLFPILAMVWFVGCARQDEHSAPAAETHKSDQPQSRVRPGTNGGVVITLDAATQQLMGLQTAALSPARLEPEVIAYGRVLDGSALAALVSDLVANQSEAKTAQTELERLKTLAGQDNASQRALEVAQAAAVRSQTQLASTHLRLLANWGSAIADRDDLPNFVRGLITLSNTLVLLEQPAGEAIPGTPLGARLLSLAPGTAAMSAQFLGPAPSVDPQMQGRGFFFLVSPNPAGLAPGAALTGYLQLPGDALSGVALPTGAILRYNGATWVYRQTGNDSFERVGVLLERPIDQGWFIRDPFRPQDKVVVVGAQQLLSEELKGQLGEQ